MEFLDTLQPFKALSERGRSLLRQGVVLKQCHAAAAVLHKGQPISGAYFVVQGRLRVYALAPDGSEATLYTMDPGETCVFALNSLFNDLRYPAWVQAEAATTVALIPGPLFRTLFEREPAVQDVTVRALSNLVFRLMEQLEQVHAYRLDQRLANLLLVHANAEGELHMTQQQMAQHLGTSREVVARILGRFAAQHWVQTGRGVLQVRHAKALADLIAQV